MHGHIEESGPITAGPLPREALGFGIRRALEQFATDRVAKIQRYHGPVVLRFKVSPEGKVTDARILLDRVFHEQDGDVEWTPLRAKLLEAFGEAIFPPTPGTTTVTVPMTFGGPVQPS